MRKLYIIRDCYVPNIASINRTLALARGYGELGVQTEVVFIFPNYEKDKVKAKFLNVSFNYLWEKYCPENKYLKHLLCRLFLMRFILKLQANDTVILYGTINPWYLFFINMKIKIYNEITEHPSVHTEPYGFIGKIQYWAFKKFCQRINGVLPISPSLSNFFVNEFGIKKNKVCTINMIVDSTRFEYIGNIEKKNTITYCGTISESKDGISDLLKAFKIVSEENENLTLKLIGGFENAVTRENVHDFIRSLGIQNKVIITGVISADQMPLLLSEAKILVLSRPQSKQAQYGFPTKLGEYLMTANPVVITDVGDFNVYLKDKEDVIYTQPNNYNDFANKLLWVLDNYERAEKIGMNGKTVALTCFNYKVEAQKVLNFIEL